MSQATQDIWDRYCAAARTLRARAAADPLGALRDTGSVDISPTVRIEAAGDEKQTASIVLTLSLDEASQMAADLEYRGHRYWVDTTTVTQLRKALGLAGCWVELQEGP